MCAARIEKLERQVEVQRQRLGQSYQSKGRIAELEAALHLVEEGRDQVQERLRELTRIANEKVAELTGELARYRKIADLFDHAKLETRFMHLGEQVQYHPLTPQGIMGGFGYWQDFAKRAAPESLIKAIATAEEYLGGLIALRGGPRERRIAELERQVKDLEARLDSEEIAPAKARATKRKKPEEVLPLPTDLVYWRQFANLHGVSQNEVTEAVGRGYIHLQRGSWKMGDDYVTQSLDTQGQHEFWVQFHASDKFRACDTCPH